MSIHLYEVGLFNTNKQFVWGKCSARATIKLFYLCGKDVSLSKRGFTLHGYASDTPKKYLSKIKKVLSDT